MSQEYMKPSEFARRMGYATETIRRKIREGVLPAEKRGRMWYVKVPQAAKTLKEPEDTTDRQRTERRLQEDDGTRLNETEAYGENKEQK